MIEFNCFKCGNSIKVPDKAAGRRGTCKKCGETVQVPIQPPTKEPTVIHEKSGSLTESERTKRKQFRTPPWPVRILLTALFVVAIGGISYYFLSGEESSDSIITKNSDGLHSNKTPVTQVLENKDRESAGENTDSINTTKPDELSSKKLPDPEILEKGDKVAASKKILDAIRGAFFVAMETIHKEPSSNQFIQSQNIKEVAKAKTLLDTILSTDYMFYDWRLMATKVKQSDNGEIVVVSTLCIFKDKNDEPKGALVANFIPKNQACLDKVKKLNTPCFVTVSGQYGGKRDKSGDDYGLYEMYFDLFDVEE